MSSTFIRTATGAEISEIRLPGRTEYLFNFNGPSAIHCDSSTEERIKGCDAEVVSSLAFGGSSSRPVRPGINVPITDKSCGDSQISSVQSLAVSSRNITPLIHGGNRLGFICEDENSRQCRLCGILPDSPSSPRKLQARQVLQKMKSALESAGFKFTDTVRTWFYLDNILDWYGEFNTERTQFFSENGVFGSLLPASTGIGAGNPSGAALCVDLLAIKPKNSRTFMKEIASPMQNSATEYRSSFSRAVLICEPGLQKLLVSGTASIGRDGRTEHSDSPEGQIELTIDVIGAILESQKMGWNSICRSIVYFTDRKLVPVFENSLKKRGVAQIPAAYAFADICRKDLFFEIELDAIRLDFAVQ